MVKHGLVVVPQLMKGVLKTPFWSAYVILDFSNDSRWDISIEELWWITLASGISF